MPSIRTANARRRRAQARAVERAVDNRALQRRRIDIARIARCTAAIMGDRRIDPSMRIPVGDPKVPEDRGAE